jgi:hypothetical protein
MHSRLSLDVTSIPGRRRAALRAGAIVLSVAVAAVVTDGGVAWASARPVSVSYRLVERGGSGSPVNTAAKNRATWGLAPASKDKIDGRPDYKWFVSPGAVLHDHVAIENLSKRQLKLYVYARDATNAPNGQLALQPRQAIPTGIGAWVTIDIPRHRDWVIVAARSTLILPFTVQIPANANPGDYTGGVISALNAKVTTSGGRAIAPTLQQRVAVPMIARVSGPIHPGLTIENLHASYKGTLNPVGDGHATVTYRVINTGNVNIGARQEVVIRGLFGTTTRIEAPLVPALLPGNSETVTLPIASVFPEFLDTVKIVLIPLIPSGDVDGAVPQPGSSERFFAIPWILVLLTVLLVVLVVVELRRRRSSARSTQAVAPKGAGPIKAPPNAPETT